MNDSAGMIGVAKEGALVTERLKTLFEQATRISEFVRQQEDIFGKLRPLPPMEQSRPKEPSPSPFADRDIEGKLNYLTNDFASIAEGLAFLNKNWAESL